MIKASIFAMWGWAMSLLLYLAAFFFLFPFPALPLLHGLVCAVRVIFFVSICFFFSCSGWR